MFGARFNLDASGICSQLGLCSKSSLEKTRPATGTGITSSQNQPTKTGSQKLCLGAKVRQLARA